MGASSSSVLVALVDIGIIKNCSDGATRNFVVQIKATQCSTSGMSCFTINLHPWTLTLHYAQLVMGPGSSRRPHSQFCRAFREHFPKKESHELRVVHVV